MNKLLRTCRILIILLGPVKCLAQENYSVAQYTGDNGLPQNSIKSIVADSYGFLWLATEDGLVRFDGREFFVYNKSNLNIPDNRVLFIHRTKKASTRFGAPRSQTCVAYFRDDNAAIRIENGLALRDTLYDLTRKRKIQSLYDQPGQLIVAKDAPDNIGIQIPFQRYLVSAGGDDENFYVCDSSQIKYYNHWKIQFRVSFPSKNLWNFFSIKGKLYYFDQQGDALTQIAGGKIKKMPLSGDIRKDPAFGKRKNVIRLYWNHNADQAFLALGENLYFLTPTQDGSVTTMLLVGKFDLRSREIKQILYDGVAQKVFLGSATQGMYILTKWQFRVVDSQHLFPNNVFYGQLPYNHNSIVTPRGDLVGFDPLTQTPIDGKVGAFTNALANDERMMTRDHSGNIWARSDRQLIQRDSLARKVLRTLNFTSEIRTICQGESRWLWIGVLNQGLYRIDTSRPSSAPELFIKDSLLKLTYLQCNSNSELLIGTTTGLYGLDILSKKLKLVEATNGVFIKSIHPMRGGIFWITALEKGLMLLTKTHKIVSFPIDKKRYLASAHCAIDDGRGYLWVTTNRGLFQMSIKALITYAQLSNISPTGSITTNKKNKASLYANSNLFYAYHTMDEGFKTNEFNGSCIPCAVKLANGNISLPSINGLVWFKPELINNTYFPNDSIVFDRLEVNQTAIQIRSDTFRLPLAPKNIRIHFTTAYFGNNYNLNLSYALLKDDESTNEIIWTPIENEDLTIRYSSLESGRYLLLIKKMNGFEIDKVQIKKVYLDVPLFWHETTWARIGIGLLSVFLLAVIMYVYNRYKLRSAEIERARLEALVFDRTADVLNTLKQLEQSKTEMSEQIYTMSRVLTSITHDIQSPLKYITYSSAGVSAVIKNGQYEDAAEITASISDLSYRISVMLGDLLDYIRVQVYGKRVEVKEIPIKSLIQEKTALFESLIHQNGSVLLNRVPEGLKVSSDYLLLSIIIHNLLDNASKYTHSGTIEISSSAIDLYKTELVISNSGSGISKEMISMLNSPKTGTEIKVKDQKVSGLGLLIVKEIADLLNISLHVTQSDGARTSQTLFRLVFENKTEMPVDRGDLF